LGNYVPLVLSNYPFKDRVSNFRRRCIIAALVACATSAALAPAALAGPIVDSAPDCKAQPLEQTFLPWADIAHYTPVPHGSFERGARGWQLAGGARIAEGNEPFESVGDPGDHRLLELPTGSVATSPAICVGLGHPTMRFFLKGTDGLATVSVEVLFEDTSGEVHTLPVGLVPAGPTWAPGLPVLVVANLLPLLPDEHTAVAFRLRALTGDVVVDETHVDPWRMR
jgi:hypothetical protein